MEYRSFTGLPQLAHVLVHVPHQRCNEEATVMYSLNEHPTGGEYTYESRTNRLKSVAANMGGESADNRNMSDSDNFVYDSEGNLTEDKSKGLKISYDWRGMPIEFKCVLRIK